MTERYWKKKRSALGCPGCLKLKDVELGQHTEGYFVFCICGVAGSRKSTIASAVQCWNDMLRPADVQEGSKVLARQTQFDFK